MVLPEPETSVMSVRRPIVVGRMKAPAIGAKSCAAVSRAIAPSLFRWTELSSTAVFVSGSLACPRKRTKVAAAEKSSEEGSSGTRIASALVMTFLANLAAG
jgi:hypothetical protein